MPGIAAEQARKPPSTTKEKNKTSRGERTTYKIKGTPGQRLVFTTLHFRLRDPGGCQADTSAPTWPCQLLWSPLAQAGSANTKAGPWRWGAPRISAGDWGPPVRQQDVKPLPRLPFLQLALWRETQTFKIGPPPCQELGQLPGNGSLTPLAETPLTLASRDEDSGFRACLSRAQMGMAKCAQPRTP